jgi:type II secretory pathway component PulC
MTVDKHALLAVVPKVNVVLLALAALLTLYLGVSIVRSYRPIPLSKEKFIRNSFKLKEWAGQELEKISGFDASVFERRSLFTQARQEKGQEPAVKIELLGIVTVGKQHAAMLRDTGDNTEHYCLGGEEIAGFLVKDIFADRVVLERDGRELELIP